MKKRRYIQNPKTLKKKAIDKHTTKLLGEVMSLILEVYRLQTNIVRKRFLQLRMVFCTDDMATGVRDAFTYCCRCKGRKVTLSDHEDNDDKLIGDFDYDHEVVVFEIRSGAMEKLRKKSRTGMEILTYQPTKQCNIEKKEVNEFCSVRSSFSECCMSDLSIEGYMTAKTEFSKNSSLKGLELENQWKMHYVNEFRKGSVIQELCHCQGWPFGLGRKAAFLPPLPKSPAESWSWRKPTRVTPIPFV